MALRAFTVAEEAIWLSERPGDPRIIALVCRLGAPADVEQLNRAFGQLIRSRPALTVRPTSPKRLARQRFWVSDQERDIPALAVARGAEDAVAAMVERLRLSVAEQAPGIAVGLVQAPTNEGGDHLVLIVHHALTDGQGALELLRELLEAVASEPTEVTAPPAPAVAARISRRGGGVGPWWKVRAPARLVRESAARSGEGFGYRMTALNLVKPPGPATTNDVLVAATVLAVEHWNTSHGRQTGDITVHLPISTRRLPAQYAEIGNATGRATFSARAGSRDRRGLLADVTAASTAAKGANVTAFSPAESAVIALRWLPAGVRAAVLRRAGRIAAPWIMPTVTVSNLGPVDGRLVDRDGQSLGVQSLHFMTTAGMPQGLTVTAAKLHGTLNVGVSFSHALMDDHGAESFLDMIVKNAEQLAEAVTGS